MTTPTESSTTETTTAPQWGEIEITLTGEKAYERPYVEVEVWVDFTHETNRWIRRPAFWDGGSTWKVRFASPLGSGTWRWRSEANVADPGLVGRTGTLEAAGPRNQEDRFQARGFWRMGPSGRNLMHADGTADLLVADTVWALPWRARPEEVRHYAAKRQSQGFNAALLMTVMPDRFAEGPRERGADQGFDIGFTDLPDGHLNELRPEYFQYLDGLLAILVEHGIVPVHQPLFHGYGWKGLNVAGNVVPPDEYARFCRYLVARYGARPAIWLVGGDGKGNAPGLEAGGKAIEQWDAYQQPTGLHYAPHAVPDAFQDAEWLDFQWCQTGHDGEHIPERVADMWRNLPPKGVANGEPTYENIGRDGKAAGWWQGHEAWSNLIAGGTMGVVYGAGSLWGWQHHPDEPGNARWTYAEGYGWREALEFEGATYVGILGKLLRNLPLDGMAPHWEAAIARGVLAVPGELAIVYRPNGNGFGGMDRSIIPDAYTVYNAHTGEAVLQGRLDGAPFLQFNLEGPPAVVVFQKP